MQRIGPAARQHGIFSCIPHPSEASVLLTVALPPESVTSNVSPASGQSVFVRQVLSHGDMQDVTSDGTSTIAVLLSDVPTTRSTESHPGSEDMRVCRGSHFDPETIGRVLLKDARIKGPNPWHGIHLLRATPAVQTCLHNRPRTPTPNETSTLRNCLPPPQPPNRRKGGGLCPRAPRNLCGRLPQSCTRAEYATELRTWPYWRVRKCVFTAGTKSRTTTAFPYCLPNATMDDWLEPQHWKGLKCVKHGHMLHQNRQFRAVLLARCLIRRDQPRYARCSSGRPTLFKHGSECLLCWPNAVAFCVLLVRDPFSNLRFVM